MSTTNQHLPTSLISPGQLFAEIPGILGFYPRESVVVMCLAHNDGTRYQLGPVLRLDLGETADLARLPHLLSSVDHPVDRALALIVTETPDSPEATTSRQVLSGADLPLIEMVWQTTDLLSESSFTLVHGPDELMQELENNSQEFTPWTQGVVAPVDQAASTRSLLSSGQIISTDRDEATAWFDADNDQLTADQRAELSQETTSRIAALISSDNPTDGVREVILGLRAALESYQAVATGANGAAPVVIEDLTMGDASVLALAGVALSGVHTNLRDLALGEVMDYPDAGQALTVALSRTACPDSAQETRANALCAYFLGGVRSGHDMCDAYAQLALHRAREIAPDHTLTSLLMVAHREHNYHHLHDLVSYGIDKTRQEYGLERD